jgi:hypothetical protein
MMNGYTFLISARQVRGVKRAGQLADRLTDFFSSSVASLLAWSGGQLRVPETLMAVSESQPNVDVVFLVVVLVQEQGKTKKYQG